MRMVLIRIGLVAGTVMLGTYSPLAWALTLWVLVVWLVPRACWDYREIRRLRPMAGLLMLRIDTLERELASAADLNACLQKQVAELRDQLASRRSSRSERADGHPLFRRVGLHQDAPKWVIEVVRREYRRRLHPDGKPAEQKAEAERRFKAAEEVFAEIWRARRL